MKGPTLAHRLEYGALRAMLWGFALLPWRWAVAAGGALGSLGYLLGIRRTVVERQIAAAFPGLAPREVARIARASYANLGKVAIEAALLSRLGAPEILALFDEVSGWDAVERARAGGKGIVFLTGHLGNWELAGAFVAAHGIAFDAVARRMGNPLFDAYLTRTRRRLGMNIVPDAEAVRRVPRTLRAGGSAAFLADQSGLNLASTYVPFFGRPAKTPRGPAVFALRYDAPVILGIATHLPHARFRMTFEPVEFARTGDLDRDTDALLAAYSRALEKHVRAVPEQYFWQHRRWKWQPAGTPPELSDPTA
ncbi:MAG TPA: lysophospholipid acyltransferase family protein [Gemmatimonadaceae bacterium]|nr:lysophospholipid acyltransferase family protein [Gemmatimonadaceae bacterium]